jgi:uncharacterized damage-inducible protein DinB
MQPDQARLLFNFLFPRLKIETGTTRRIIAAVPADRSDYAPHPTSMTALKLCGHIAGTEIWFLAAILNLKFAEEDADDGAPPPNWNTPNDVLRWYDAELATRLPKLEALSDEHLVTPINYLGILNDPAVNYFNIAILHSVHHRGQLSSYLRPMGAKVPAIYVESGDQQYVPGEPSGW